MVTNETIFRTLVEIYDEDVQTLLQYDIKDELSEEFIEDLFSVLFEIEMHDICVELNVVEESTDLEYFKNNEILIEKLNELQKLLYDVEYQEYLTENGF